MKKRVLSALLVLCMACSMVSTVWATETNATSGAPEPASQTLNLDNEQSGNESGADSTGAPSDSTDSSTSASSDSTSSGSSSAASDATSDATSGAVSDATSGEGDEGAASSEVDGSEGISTPSPTPTLQPESTEEPAVTPSPEPTSSVEPTPEPMKVQVNSAPAAAPQANEDISVYAAGETSSIFWGNYFRVTLHYVGTDGKSLDYDFTYQQKEVTNGNSQAFMNMAHPFTFETDTATYTYKEARLDNAQTGDVVTSLSATQKTEMIFWTTYYYTFYNGSDLVRELEDSSYGQTADVYLIYEAVPKTIVQPGQLKIEDSVATDGLFTAAFVNPAPQGTFTYTWERSLNPGDDSSWQEVTSQKVTGEEYNWRPESANQINVALDALLMDAEEDDRYTYRVTATDENGTTYVATMQVPYYIELQNGSFEEPSIPDNQFNMQWANGQPNLIWQTTGPGEINERYNQDIEIIEQGHDDTYTNYGVRVAAHGEQFAELNCEAYGALYQDVMTAPGATLNWSFSHLARDIQDRNVEYSDSVDKMAMVIMPADRADALADDLQDAAAKDDPAAEIEKILGELGEDCYVYYAEDKTYERTGKWVRHSSDDGGEAQAYVVPEGQYLTRFFFIAVDTGYDEKNPSSDKFGTVGNLIDYVSFGSNPNPAADDEAQLTVRKTVSGLSEEEMEDYSITLTVDTDGDGEENNKILFEREDFGPSVGGNYTAEETITYKVNANNGSKTVTVSETQPQVTGYTVGTSYVVTGAVEQNGTGTKTEEITIPARQNVTVTFTNTYTPTTTDLTITKTFVGLDKEKANQVWGDITFTTEGKRATKNSESVTAGGDGTFTATATISGLTIGQDYTITETGAMVDSYTLKTTATGVDDEQEVTEGTPPHASIDALIAGATVNFTNTYTRQTGTLVLNKDIAGLPTLTEDDQEKVNALIYNFIITGPADAVGVVAVDNDGDDNDIVFVANGNGGATATVPVAVGTNVRIENLPTGPYTVTEVLPSAEAPNSNYEILDGKYYFDETVADNGNSWSGNLTKTGATATITNTYAPYYTVTVTKQVGGAMGSSEETFTFTSEQINGLNANNITIADGSKASLTESGFTMKAGGSLTVNKVKKSTCFSIVEVKAEGYVTTVMIDGADNTAGTDAPTTAYFTVGEEDVTVTYQNDRAAVAPTGLESNHTTPYVLMITAAGMAGLALIGGMAARRIRRRRED